MWVSHTEGDVTTTVWVDQNRAMFWSLIFFFGGLLLLWNYARSGVAPVIVIGCLLAAFGALGFYRARRLISRSNRAYDAAYRE